VRGRFITLEGGEGAGKSTQAERLGEYLRGRGLPVVLTREPGGTPSAEAIRAMLVTGAGDKWKPATEVLLHYAARNEHVERKIKPALAEGKWVVCDRFADSTMAYQGYGQGNDPAMIAGIHKLVLGDFAPDLTLVLDLPVDEGLARAASRRGTENRYEGLGTALHERIRAAFLSFVEREPQRYVRIDAAQPLEAVTRDVLAAVARQFSLPG
jgi:dTMP kinase